MNNYYYCLANPNSEESVVGISLVETPESERFCNDRNTRPPPPHPRRRGNKGTPSLREELTVPRPTRLW